MEVDEDTKPSVVLMDLEKESPGRDVVFRCADSGGKEIFVSKKKLCDYSPYFKQFFSDNCEKHSYSVDLSDDHSAVLEVMRIVYNDGQPYQIAKYEPKLLAEMYAFADRCGIEAVKEVCVQQLEEQTSADTLEIALKLDLADVKTKIMGNMDRVGLLAFLNTDEDAELRLTKKDVKFMIDKVSNTVLASEYLFPSPSTVFIARGAYYNLLKVSNISDSFLACRFCPSLSRTNSYFTFLGPDQSVSVRVYRHLALPSETYTVDFITVSKMKGDPEDPFKASNPTGSLSVKVVFD